MIELRPYHPDDEAAVADVWHRSGLEEYHYLPDFQALSTQQAREVFARVIVPGAQLQVAWLEGRAIGFIALRGSYIDRLYVVPNRQRQGCGGHLLDWARQQCPQGLELHTHQQNHRARAFYHQQGFRAVGFGFSPAPESVPDVEYQWRPAEPKIGD